MIRLNDCLNMTIAVDWDVKPQTKRANQPMYQLRVGDHNKLQNNVQTSRKLKVLNRFKTLMGIFVGKYFSNIP